MASTSQKIVHRFCVESARNSRKRQIAELLRRYLYSAWLLALGVLGCFAIAAQSARAATLVDLAPLPAAQTFAPKISCDNLTNIDLTNLKDAPTRIRSAKIEAKSGLRAEFCVVSGYVSPQVKFELRLPSHGYTGRYLQGGCGGNCGFIGTAFYPSCINDRAYTGDFAVSFNNSGHDGNVSDGLWASGDPALRKDFAERAAHVVAIASKAIIQAYYGASPKHSYMVGCSDGGREVMVEAQRFPSDFDGLVAGSPAHDISAMMIRFFWESRLGNIDGKPVFTPEAIRLLHTAVISACDALDGLKDGQIDDARKCRFDPVEIECSAKLTANCLTHRQVEVARAFYGGPIDAAGDHIYGGGAPYGSEPTWIGPGAISSQGGSLAGDFVKYMIYGGNPPPNSGVNDVQFDVATVQRLMRDGASFDARDPDLRPFRSSGGKMIIWEGDADPAAGSWMTLDYYQAVRRIVGGMNAARSFVRVFKFPGTYHCRDGYTPYQADLLGSIVWWAEAGRTPDKLDAVATLEDGSTRRRPIFAYPVVARYIGHGDINSSGSFVGKWPNSDPHDSYNWAFSPNK